MIRGPISLWLLAGLAAVPLLALPREKDRWIELETASFTLWSGAGRATTEDVVQHLEELRSALAQLYSWELDAAVPTRVYVFDGDKKFTPYKSLFEGKTVEGAGYFLARPDINVIAVNGGSFNDSAKLLYHEYVHELVNNNVSPPLESPQGDNVSPPLESPQGDNVRGLPLWLNEGMAEYYSTFKVVDGRAEVGHAIPEHVTWLRRSELISLEELYAIGPDSAEYNEGVRRGGFYAASWAFVHYLASGSRQRQGQLPRYVRLLMLGEAEEVAFAEAFATDYEALEAELRSYVRRAKWPVAQLDTGEPATATFQVPSGGVRGGNTVRTMSYEEVLAHLGDLLIDLDRHEAAAEHFRALLARRASDPRGLAGLAALACRSTRYDEGLDLYRRALASGDDFIVRYRHANCLLARDPDDPNRRTEAIRSLRRAVELEPDFGPARTLLSELVQIEDRVREARAAVRENNRFAERYNEALAFVEDGDLAAARVVLEELVGSNDAERAAKARGLMERLDRRGKFDAAFERSNRLLNERRWGDAVALLRQVDVEPDSTEGRWIAEEIVRIERARAKSLFHERFNEALGHYQDGNMQEAGRILEELLESLPGDSVEAERTRVLLGKARAELKRRDERK